MFKNLFACFGQKTTPQGQIAPANQIDIWYETFGQRENPAVLLIMGGCCQGVLWDQGFCQRLADAGFFVIRYDHRDAGLSTCFDFEKEPYDLMDMTQDAVSLLDVLGIEKAHVFGLSLGAFLAESMAAHFPEKVHSILLMSSTCDIRPMNLALAGLPPEEGALFPPPTSQYLEWMQEFMKLIPQNDEERLAQRLEGWNRLNGYKRVLNKAINQKIHQTFLARLRYPQGMVNHILMLRTPQAEKLIQAMPSKIGVPTVILHGSEDPIFPPEHGEALRRVIQNAEYHLIEGMGHIPSDHFYDLYIDILKRQALQKK